MELHALKIKLRFMKKGAVYPYEKIKILSKVSRVGELVFRRNTIVMYGGTVADSTHAE